MEEPRKVAAGSWTPTQLLIGLFLFIIAVPVVLSLLIGILLATAFNSSRRKKIVFIVAGSASVLLVIALIFEFKLIEDPTALFPQIVDKIDKIFVPNSGNVKEESADPQGVDVMFATNRVIDSQAPTVLQQISFKRSPELTYGVANVRVPEEHVVGSVERPLSLTVFGVVLFKGGEVEKEHFVMKGLQTIDRNRAVDLLKARKDRGAMIFVHGYNTSFEDSIFRSAQLAYDTRFPGTPIAFVWPSKGGWADYDYDRESAQFSREVFLRFLYLVQGDGEVSKIYVIAHSMGNQIVMDARRASLLLAT